MLDSVSMSHAGEWRDMTVIYKRICVHETPKSGYIYQRKPNTPCVRRVHRVSHMDRRRNFKNVYEQEKFPEHHLLEERALREMHKVLRRRRRKEREKTFVDKWIFGVAQFCAIKKIVLCLHYTWHTRTGKTSAWIYLEITGFCSTFNGE